MRRLGYCPAVNLDEGLKRTAAWYLDHHSDVVDNDLM
jgi:UDP-glucose 4-epimerase